MYTIVSTLIGLVLIFILEYIYNNVKFVQSQKLGVTLLILAMFCLILSMTTGIGSFLCFIYICIVSYNTWIR